MDRMGNGSIAGRRGVPADATATAINLTVTGAAGPGFATAYPCGTLPKASSINYDATSTRPNELITKLSPHRHDLHLHQNHPPT